MFIGIGLDVVEIDRIGKALTKQGFKEKVYTPEEITYCEARGAHAKESYAARFAAKEAVGKAFGVGITKSSLLEIGVKNAPSGQPEVILTGRAKEFAKKKGMKKIHITISHIAAVAIASVVVEG